MGPAVNTSKQPHQSAHTKDETEHSNMRQTAQTDPVDECSLEPLLKMTRRAKVPYGKQRWPDPADECNLQTIRAEELLNTVTDKYIINYKLDLYLRSRVLFVDIR